MQLPLQFRLQEKIRQNNGQAAKFSLPQSHFRNKNVWILKATGFNRGIGIHVFNKIEDLYKILREYAETSSTNNHFSDQMYKCQILLQKQVEDI